MKTIRGWAEALPTKIKDRFYANMRDSEILDEKFSSFKHSVSSAFTWGATPEKHKYWDLVSNGKFDEAELSLTEPEHPESYLSDFKNTLEKLESLLRLGATKSGRYRGQWKEDRFPSYHIRKALGHIVDATESTPTAIDQETGSSHLINAIARLMIAHEQECLLKEAN